MNKKLTTLEDIEIIERVENSVDCYTNYIVSNIRSYRIAQGISQSELSRRSGVPQKTISRMENGLSSPALSTLIKLLNTLHLDISINIKPNN